MKPLPSTSKVKLYELIQLLEDLIPVGRTVLNNFPTYQFKEPMFIRVSLFERSINRIEVMIPLMKQWEKNPNVEDSIGIIIRACLADVISQFYLEDVHSRVKPGSSHEEREYLQVASDFLADHIFSGMKYLKGLKDGGVFTNEFYRNGIDNWKSLYPRYFKDELIDYDRPAKNLTVKVFPSPIQILKSIRHSKLLGRHNLDDLYTCYFFYSKYEHFGATTNSLQNSDMNTLFYFMMDSISYILLACQISSVHFEHAFYRFKEESRKIYLTREEFVRIITSNRPKEHFL